MLMVNVSDWRDYLGSCMGSENVVKALIFTNKLINKKRKKTFLLQRDIPKPSPQSRALCGAVCALSITIALY